MKYATDKENISFWKFYLLIFVVFSLYLLGDVFYRWDGFRVHSTFIEFMPSVALAMILWSICALAAAVLCWLLLGSIKWVCRCVGLRFAMEDIILYCSIATISGALAWKGKKYLFPLVETTYQIKLGVLTAVLLIALVLSRRLRNRSCKIVRVVSERITPLVWIFGMFLLIAFFTVIYQTWIKDLGNEVSRKVTASRLAMSDNKRPNIILVTFDALAAKDMSSYGYHRQTTPFIDEWAKEATLFSNLQAASNWTTSATTSLMTGKRLWTHLAAHLQGKPALKIDIESLPLLLKKNGYFNMAFIANKLALVNRLGIAESFDIAPSLQEFTITRSLFGELGVIDVFLYQLFGKKIQFYDWIISDDFILSQLQTLVSRKISETSSPPVKVFSRFLNVLDNNPPEPFFAWIHIMPPHDPYLPPDPYLGMYDGSQRFRDFTSQQDIRLKSIEYLHKFLPYPEEMQPSIDVLRSRYNEFLRYCDKTFEDFIQQLSKKRQTGNTVLILSSDHGESFENGYFLHAGPFMYNPVTHIPFIIKLPDQHSGQTIDDLVEQVDIPATILDLVGISVPSWIEGRSLMPLIRGKSLPPQPAFSMYLGSNPNWDREIKKGSFAVWEDDYKLIYYLEKGETLLFNLRQDPGELSNIIENEPEKGQHLLGLINENIKAANERIIAENN